MGHVSKNYIYDIYEASYHFATVEAPDAETAIDIAYEEYTYVPDDYNCTQDEYCDTQWCARSTDGSDTCIKTVVLNYGRYPEYEQDSDEVVRADYMYDRDKDDRLTGDYD